MINTESRLETIERRLDELNGYLAGVELRMLELHRDGWIGQKNHFGDVPSQHMREGKYLYLIFPMAGGSRDRIYIGSDPNKIRAAKEGIKRQLDYAELLIYKNKLKNAIDYAEHYLALAAEALREFASF